MVFQNARYCNGFPTIRRKFDTFDDSISSIISDVFSLFLNFLVTKMGTAALGLSPNCDGIIDLSMQSGWGDGCDLRVCKAGSKEHQEREGKHARGEENLYEMRRPMKHEPCEVPFVFWTDHDRQPADLSTAKAWVRNPAGAI